MEEHYDPFAPKGRARGGEDDDSNERKSRKERLVAAAKLVENSPKKSKKKSAQKINPPVPTAKEDWKTVTRKRAGPKRNPHRRSSVSSVDRIEVSTTSRATCATNFSFISAPSKAALDKIETRHQLKTIAEESSAAPQRLLGSKRFVFGR
jgi:hypothetical protein